MRKVCLIWKYLKLIYTLPDNTPPSSGMILKWLKKTLCHQNPLPAPPWHSPVWWHVRPKYENILAKEMRLVHQSIVEPLMKKKHFGAMIWKIFLGMFQFSQIFQISTKAERTFEWKVIFTLLWVPPVSLLESCDTQRRRSSSFSTNTQISRACFQIGKLGKIKCLNK